MMTKLSRKVYYSSLIIGTVVLLGAQPIYAHDETPGDQPPQKGSAPALSGRPIGEEAYGGPTWVYISMFLASEDMP